MSLHRASLLGTLTLERQQAYARFAGLCCPDSIQHVQQQKIVLCGDHGLPFSSPWMVASFEKLVNSQGLLSKLKTRESGLGTGNRLNIRPKGVDVNRV